MTDEHSAQAEQPTPVRKDQPLPSSPVKTPAAAMAIHSCLDARYKALSLEVIAENLAQVLETPGSRRTLLNRQVQVLDALFNRVIMDAPKDMQHLPLLDLALKAQRQCQITSASISTQKKIDKQTDSSADAMAAMLKRL